MARLIDDLLAYSRIERRALSPQPLVLDALVNEVIEECTGELTSRNVQLELEVPPLPLSADAEALMLVVRHLVGNAIKFTRAVPQARIEIKAKVVDRHVEICVHDNGIGFDMQYHDQIFKLFHRLHRDVEYQGTGIGLALVRKALERMGGRVRAHSTPGQGATFIVDLPC
jgi:signal transduction histidine kinase